MNFLNNNINYLAAINFTISIPILCWFVPLSGSKAVLDEYILSKFICEWYNNFLCRFLQPMVYLHQNMEVRLASTEGPTSFPKKSRIKVNGTHRVTGFSLPDECKTCPWFTGLSYFKALGLHVLAFSCNGARPANGYARFTIDSPLQQPVNGHVNDVFEMATQIQSPHCQITPLAV